MLEFIRLIFAGGDAHFSLACSITTFGRSDETLQGER